MQKGHFEQAFIIFQFINKQQMTTAAQGERGDEEEKYERT